MTALHEYVKNRFPKPEFCEHCKKISPKDLANISGKYKRNLNDWEWLCRKCHMISDGRMEKWKKVRKNRPNKYKGKKFEKIYGKEKAKEMIKKMKKRRHSEESKKKMSISAKNRKKNV